MPEFSSASPVLLWITLDLLSVELFTSYVLDCFTTSPVSFTLCCNKPPLLTSSCSVSAFWVQTSVSSIQPGGWFWQTELIKSIISLYFIKWLVTWGGWLFIYLFFFRLWLYVDVYGRVGVDTHAFLSYLGSRGLLGRLLVRSLLSVPPDGRSGPEPGLTRLIKRKQFFSEPSQMKEKQVLKARLILEGF